MFQIFKKGADVILSLCYLTGFCLQESNRLQAERIRGKNTRVNKLGRICSRDDNSAQ
jgi:hypothetical protein